MKRVPSVLPRPASSRLVVKHNVADSSTAVKGFSQLGPACSLADAGFATARLVAGDSVSLFVYSLLLPRKKINK